MPGSKSKNLLSWILNIRVKSLICRITIQLMKSHKKIYFNTSRNNNGCRNLEISIILTKQTLFLNSCYSCKFKGFDV